MAHAVPAGTGCLPRHDRVKGQSWLVDPWVDPGPGPGKKARRVSSGAPAVRFFSHCNAIAMPCLMREGLFPAGPEAGFPIRTAKIRADRF